MHPLPPNAQRPSASIGLILVLIMLLAARVLGLLVSPLNLGPDEAQYWRWSTELGWGYYSKPPLIAWIIAASTSLFGDSEWAIRLPAPLLHGITAYLIYLLGRRLFDNRTGVWAAVYYLLMPGVTLSSGVITTDAVLLPCFAGAMLALWSLREAPSNTRAAILLGLAIGLGLLAKYAMVYAVLGLIAAAIVDPPTRQAVVSKRGLLAAVIALLVLVPHLAWNLQHGFQTIGHTADNANWGGPLFSPVNALQFLVDQFAVVGPIGFISLATGVILIMKLPAKSRRGTIMRWLLCFTLPVLIIITGQAFVSRAHANWAATAYVAGSLIIATTLLSDRPFSRNWWIAGAVLLFSAAICAPDLSLGEKTIMGSAFGGALLAAGYSANWTAQGVLRGSVALNAVIALIFSAVAIGPVSWSERMGLDQSFKRSRAWPQTVQELSDTVRRMDVTAVLVDERELWHAIDYYGRSDFPVPVYSWRRSGTQKSFSERADLADLDDPQILIASIKPHQRRRLRADFSAFRHVGDIAVPIGGGATRDIRLFYAEGYDLVPRTADLNGQLTSIR
ncbi:MAG: glycosyltransferase family 39 protein [Pseudomonadota bacterium]